MSGTIGPTLFLEDVRVVVDRDNFLVHLVGLQTADGERQSDLSPISHLVMSNETFRKLLAAGRSGLAKGVN